MSQVNGQLSTCERCGAQVFRKCTGEGETDGGYTRWNNFEPYPKGWGLVDVPEGVKPPYNSMRVCPDCRAAWNKAINEGFLKGTPYYKEEARA
jgi:predicted nucleic acid-binding Zn ribbon protein